ncbi:hypothetical protein D8674_000767 [Pyrus ussuriensis x Pyrus communis]|uniref:Uncharacterized protein n=1 Tax=Pyrus ussuriensis x Pyrus communis TaxID=2448454 RepID=A0A5N5F4F5_9ROSA|nr:uncharacterized protein LOC103964232 [Pyrus x bretschneideri]KAB2597847.1 hypothetical protein D8674_000767 [Pyrus ussuriensis x Pyrus communis]
METNCMSVLSCVGTNVASAFFASLERCSCINLNTADFDDDNHNITNDDRPLFLSSSCSSRPTAGSHQDQAIAGPDQPIKPPAAATHHRLSDGVSA